MYKLMKISKLYYRYLYNSYQLKVYYNPILLLYKFYEVFKTFIIIVLKCSCIHNINDLLKKYLILN